MKNIHLSVFCVLTVLMLSAQAQEKGPIPEISRQLTDYFNYYPKEKVFVVTDKTQYRPGETIWFRAFVSTAENLPVPENNAELFVKLYDKNGKVVVQDIFRNNQGSVPGDLNIPADLLPDPYFLVAYTQTFRSPERISCTPIRIDPQYNNQWVAETNLKDSLSTAGQKNVLFLSLRDISGDIQKNTSLRYQFVNGTEILDKGKIKTDDKGHVEIPLTIPEKTNGDPFFCEISDTRGNWNRKVWLPTSLDPLIVRLYPEGGNLIAGLPAKIGFTAFNKWGIPVDIEGHVANQEGKSIALVKTFTKGLGLISLASNEKQNCKLVISGQTGKNQSFDIPAPAETGLSLSVVKTDTAFISASFIFSDKQKHAVAITISRAGSLYWAADMEINGIGRIKIPTGNLPQGINLLSVFSNEGQLLAERILYTDKHQNLKIEVQPEEKSLLPNQSMKVKVRLTDENNHPVQGNIVVAVSDKFRNETSRPEIGKTLLVGSELETPFSVISSALKEKISNSSLLDVYLLANQLKGFSWNNVLKFKAGNAPDLRSVNNEIRGVVTDKNGNKVNKAKVSLVNNRNIQLYTTTTNDDGMFSFPGQNTATSEDFSVKATDPEGKRELHATFGRNFEGQVSEFVKNVALTNDLTWKDRFTDEKYAKENSFLFGKAPKTNYVNTAKQDNQRKMLESATSIMDVIKTLKPYRILNNMIVFAGSENSLMAQGGALLVVDGQQMGTDISSIANISPLEVDHINVSTNAMDIQRYTGLNSVGIVEIFLKNGKKTEPEDSQVIKNKYESGFRVPNVFQSGAANQKNNPGTTLLWIPDQPVNETGQFEFTLTAGKVVSDFIIDVQGKTPDGRMGSGTAVISVTR